MGRGLSGSFGVNVCVHGALERPLFTCYSTNSHLERTARLLVESLHLSVFLHFYFALERRAVRPRLDINH